MAAWRSRAVHGALSSGSPRSARDDDGAGSAPRDGCRFPSPERAFSRCCSANFGRLQAPADPRAATPFAVIASRDRARRKTPVFRLVVAAWRPRGAQSVRRSRWIASAERRDDGRGCLASLAKSAGPRSVRPRRQTSNAPCPPPGQPPAFAGRGAAFDLKPSIGSNLADVHDLFEPERLWNMPEVAGDASHPSSRIESSRPLEPWEGRLLVSCWYRRRRALPKTNKNTNRLVGWQATPRDACAPLLGRFA